MALSEMTARNAKPTTKPFKLYDEGGLYLFVTPSGGKFWRVKYRWQGAEKVLSVGSYPEISLKDARQRRDDARVLLANAVDPYEERKREEKAKILEKSSTLRVGKLPGLAKTYEVAVEVNDTKLAAFLLHQNVEALYRLLEALLQAFHSIAVSFKP